MVDLTWVNPSNAKATFVQGSTLRLALLHWARLTVKNTVSGKFMALSKSPNRQVYIPTLIPHTKVTLRLSLLFRQNNALHSEIVILNCMPL